MRIRALQLLDVAGCRATLWPCCGKARIIFRVLGDPHALTLTVHAWPGPERDGDAGEARLLHDMVREATGRDLRGGSTMRPAGPAWR